jgi:hypothetical protein
MPRQNNAGSPRAPEGAYPRGRDCRCAPAASHPHYPTVRHRRRVSRARARNPVSNGGDADRGSAPRGGSGSSIRAHPDVGASPGARGRTRCRVQGGHAARHRGPGRAIHAARCALEGAHRQSRRPSRPKAFAQAALAAADVFQAAAARARLHASAAARAPVDPPTTASTAAVGADHDWFPTRPAGASQSTPCTSERPRARGDRRDLRARAPGQREKLPAAPQVRAGEGRIASLLSAAPERSRDA